MDSCGQHLAAICNDMFARACVVLTCCSGAECSPARDWLSVMRDAAHATLDRSCQSNLSGCAITCEISRHGQSTSVHRTTAAAIGNITVCDGHSTSVSTPHTLPLALALCVMAHMTTSIPGMQFILMHVLQ